ncbi:hypothetical protein TP2_17830 [Thioclava pacifica DSM 10166]|uniref:Uncharacterized protein n=1 Tax=Thioclava pacifica DSM 10166 TaxID=1353537 RepID=A0A074J7G3_9RHOB|nr:hypothetical protein TP2_17830 [Thioclava pacifica DSM 10166]
MQKLTTLQGIKVVIELLAGLTVIVSLVIGLMTYRAQQAQVRRDATFTVLSRLSEDRLLDVQRRISSELARSEIKKFKGVRVPRDTMATYIGSLAETSSDRLLFDQDIITLVSYFDDAEVCIETKTCDEKILSAHLDEVAVRYACLLLPYVFKMRDEYLLTGLGDRMSLLVNYETRC